MATLLLYSPNVTCFAALSLHMSRQETCRVIAVEGLGKADTHCSDSFRDVRGVAQLQLQRETGL